MTQTIEAKNIDWNYCQANSDYILLHGIKRLKESEKFKLTSPAPKTPGNYLITNNRMRFIGEATNIDKRLGSHRVPKTSTFYKNYQKAIKKNLALNQNLILADFDYQILETTIGRKEMEEFGMVNLPARLNSFQQKKRNKYKSDDISAKLWDYVQNKASKILVEGANAFKRTMTVNWEQANPDNIAGVYQLKDNQGKLLYIGESANLNERWKKHSNPAYFSALRRNIGKAKLGFELKEKDGKRRNFSDQEEIKINDFLAKCKFSLMPVAFGRFELEEHLIEENKPQLNIK